MSSGAVLGLLSAFLFGASPVLAKALLGDMSPVLLAGLLYLGSGMGLTLSAVFTRKKILRELRALGSVQRLKLAGAVLCGGILAPLFLMYALKRGSAFEVAVLLNFETVATTFLAVLLFKEHVGRRVWIGKALIVLAAVLTSLHGEAGFSISSATLLVIAACALWGMDNNLTRDIEELPATILGGVKGMVAGAFNILVSFFVGVGAVTTKQVAATLFIGWISYGLSLVLFIEALRRIGASRTSTYFATGPFLGMILAVLFLGESPPALHWAAAGLAALGCWVLYGERHEHAHVHVHKALTHRHPHRRDAHHQHSHEGWEGPEPHDHVHTHIAGTHSHPHLPDVHHRHDH